MFTGNFLLYIFQLGAPVGRPSHSDARDTTWRIYHKGKVYACPTWKLYFGEKEYLKVNNFLCGDKFSPPPPRNPTKIPSVLLLKTIKACLYFVAIKPKGGGYKNRIVLSCLGSNIHFICVHEYVKFNQASKFSNVV